jgi:hypothetical protein
MQRNRSREGSAAAPRALQAAPRIVPTTTVSTSTIRAETRFESENDFQPTNAMPGMPSLPDAFPPDPRSRTARGPNPPPSSSSTSLLDEMRFTPTPQQPTAPIPFARSKSQLTLLLERERSRLEGQQPRPSPSD